MEEELKKKIKELEDRLAKLETRRILQQDILPQVIKNRHMGEANSYIKKLASSPTGADFNENTMFYWNSTDSKLYVWNGSAWVASAALA